MAIDKKLIRFKNKEKFKSDGVNNSIEPPTSGDESQGNAVYGQIKGTSIVFIEDSREIWTHGRLYKSANWSVLEKLPQFLYLGEYYNFREGMTWEEWLNSEYNIDNCYILNGEVRYALEREGYNSISILGYLSEEKINSLNDIVDEECEKGHYINPKDKMYQASYSIQTGRVYGSGVGVRPFTSLDQIKTFITENGYYLMENGHGGITLVPFN